MSVAARRPQRGVALVTALLVVAIATVAAVSMANRQQLDIRRTASLLHGEQAWAYVLGAENWAKVVLRRDARESQIDSLAEDWSTQPPVSFVEGGSIVGRLIDLQGRFNVNNLVRGGSVDADSLEFYKRLLQRLDIDERLADPLVDWIDADINARFPDGAEDDAYLLLDPPYRAANRPLADTSELRLVKGYDAEVVAKLLPHVSALPERTALNVNTADATLLSVVAPGMTVAEGESLVEARGEEPFESVAKFMQAPALAGRTVATGTIGVTSNWFLMLSEANIGQGRARLASTIQRSRNDLLVVRRQREFFDPVVPVVPVSP
ncbi:MAG: type II secretion system minor pseudopilin GspK [Thiogranum sp.]|jgi:general secretion pathway protein K|nr:type II secretion system minor pseudopilin GspK [Thiogranum sp.]